MVFVKMDVQLYPLTCPNCDGSGFEYPFDYKHCHTCGGSGTIYECNGDEIESEDDLK